MVWCLCTGTTIQRTLTDFIHPHRINWIGDIERIKSDV